MGESNYSPEEPQDRPEEHETSNTPQEAESPDLSEELQTQATSLVNKVPFLHFDQLPKALGDLDSSLLDSGLRDSSLRNPVIEGIAQGIIDYKTGNSGVKGEVEDRWSFAQERIFRQILVENGLASRDFAKVSIGRRLRGLASDHSSIVRSELGSPKDILRNPISHKIWGFAKSRIEDQATKFELSGDSKSAGQTRRLLRFADKMYSLTEPKASPAPAKTTQV